MGNLPPLPSLCSLCFALDRCRPSSLVALPVSLACSPFPFPHLCILCVLIPRPPLPPLSTSRGLLPDDARLACCCARAGL